MILWSEVRMKIYLVESDILFFFCFGWRWLVRSGYMIGSWSKLSNDWVKKNCDKETESEISWPVKKLLYKK